MPNDSGVKLLVNSRELQAEIGVDFLMRCFGESWNDATYYWYLQREFQGEAPDRLVLVEGSRVLATAGIAYRKLRDADGAIHRVGIIVAACVAPGERGRGRFFRLRREAVRYCAERECCALLGFVTADNATCLHLRRVGAAQIPSAYLMSTGLPSEPPAITPGVAVLSHDEWQGYADRGLQVPSPAAVVGFHYPNLNAWRSQFIDRAHPIELLRVGEASRAIIERAGDTDRLQWLEADPQEEGAVIAALVERARRMRRRFFMYSTATVSASFLEGCGLKARPGFIMALATQTEYEALVQRWPMLPWRVQSGDRL